MEQSVLQRNAVRCHCPLGHRGPGQELLFAQKTVSDERIRAPRISLPSALPLLRCYEEAAPPPGLAPLGQASVHFQNPSDNSDPILPDIAGIGTIAGQGIVLAWGQPHIGQIC